MRTPSSPVAVIAHRGASAEAPEHTIAAYDLALKMGADVLEIDLRMTADGALVAVHDRTLARTLGDPRVVADVALRDLAAFDGPARPLTLAQILERYGTATRYLLDLKDPCPATEPAVASEVARAGLTASVQVQSFDRWSTKRARRADAHLRIAQLFRPGVKSARIRRALPNVATFACTIGPDAASVDAPLIAAAHAAGLRVQPYTINDPSEMDRLLALGVDGLITDHPDRGRIAASAAAAATGPVAVAA